MIEINGYKNPKLCVLKDLKKIIASKKIIISIKSDENKRIQDIPFEETRPLNNILSSESENTCFFVYKNPDNNQDGLFFNIEVTGSSNKKKNTCILVEGEKNANPLFKLEIKKKDPIQDFLEKPDVLKGFNLPSTTKSVHIFTDILEIWSDIKFYIPTKTKQGVKIYKNVKISPYNELKCQLIKIQSVPNIQPQIRNKESHSY